MEDNPIIVTLYKILPALPELAGENWAALEVSLKALLAELDRETDPQQRYRLCYEVLQLLETVPALIDLFDRELVLSDPSKSEAITRGGGGPLLGRLQSLLGPKKARERVLTRFTDISCPRRVWLQTRRISIVVRLNELSSEVSDASDETLLVQEEKPVLVQIHAPDFTLLGPGAQQLTLSSEPVSASLVFDLEPRKAGFSSIRFDFTQETNYLGSAVLPIEITETEVSVQTQEHVETLLRTTGNGEPPDFTLHITYETISSPGSLHFKLIRKGEQLGQEFHPRQLKSSLQNYTQTIYQHLTSMMLQTNPTTLAVLGTVQSMSRQAIEDSLREEGMNLWKELIPLELQERYERERPEWANKSLLIISDEPDIPWELLWPHGEGWRDPHPLCLQMNLARWLRRSPQEKTIYEPKSQLAIQKMAAIVPMGMQLAAAEEELLFLRSFMRQHFLQNVSPLEPTSAEVKQFLQQETYDWVHVATHGNFYPANPEGESAIWLLDQQPLTPHSIIGEIADAIRKQRPAFVFNACEVGRQGWTINGLGGWANRLIGAGAGLFLAPLWPVEDRSAQRFTITLYQSLKSGKTIAEAVRQARLDAKRIGDPTWLAYSLYAHPNASIS